VPARPAIQRHEWFAVAVAFVYFFCVLAAYYVIRPVRDQLSAAVGSTSLPMFYTATFLATPYARFVSGHTLVVDGANWQRRSLTNPPVVTVREQMGKGPFEP